MTSFIVSPVLAAGIMDLRPGLTIWTAITFLLLVIVLSKFAWGPIVKMLDERERTIREAIEQAKKERAEAERMLAEQTASLQAAQRDAFDEGGRDDHRGADVAGGGRLPGRTLHGRRGELADAEAGAEDREAGPEAGAEECECDVGHVRSSSRAGRSRGPPPVG